MADAMKLLFTVGATLAAWQLGKWWGVALAVLEFTR